MAWRARWNRCLRARNDEWRSAAEVDTWGFTFVASRKGDEPWKQFQAVDLVRGGSRGKPFWHAEAEAGPLWMQPQVIGRPREDGRIPDENDVRLWNMVSCAGGATGILYPRWRPLLDGPLFGAFGAFGMDGSVTPRAEMAGKFARWANAHPDSGNRIPCRATSAWCLSPSRSCSITCSRSRPNFYAQSIRGAYQAFFDSNIQADFVALDDIGKYKAIYLPYPVMLKQETVAKLRKLCGAGRDTDQRGTAGVLRRPRPCRGDAAKLTGWMRSSAPRESYVEFTPDLLDKLTLKVKGQEIYGRYFLQEYEAEGRPARSGQYANGHVAAVEHRDGQGQDAADRNVSGRRLLSASLARSQSVLRRIIEMGRYRAAIADHQQCRSGEIAQRTGRRLSVDHEPDARRSEGQRLTKWQGRAIRRRAMGRNGRVDSRRQNYGDHPRSGCGGYCSTLISQPTSMPYTSHDAP